MTEQALRPGKLDEVDAFIERFGVIVEEDGVPRTAGRMFALLLTAREPLSFSEIAERLQASRGGVSTNVRLLEEIGMIERVSRPGDRQDYFQFPADTWERQIHRQAIRERKSRMAVETLLQGADDLGAPVRQRLEYMIELLDTADRHKRQTLEKIAADRR